MHLCSTSSDLKPKFFIPVHGEYRHLKKHIRLAKDLGMKESNMLIAEIGDTVELTAKNMKMGEKFQAGSRPVDGLNIDDSGEVVRDRKHLSEDGVVVAVVCISRESGEIVQGPDLINKGTTLTDKNIEELKAIVIKSVENSNEKAFGDIQEMRNAVRKGIKNYAFKRLKHSPIILPIITEI